MDDHRQVVCSGPEGCIKDPALWGRCACDGSEAKADGEADTAFDAYWQAQEEQWPATTEWECLFLDKVRSLAEAAFLVGVGVGRKQR